MPNTIPAAGEAMPAEVQSPKMRIDTLLEEAVKIIRDNPDLMIDSATANKHGIYTSLAIPGAEEHPWLNDQIKPLQRSIGYLSARVSRFGCFDRFGCKCCWHIGVTLG
ncbi:hypothetical protein [Agrobacterium radiobacter]|uniref:hypothetical protein n=1 Tax=Agrobacterium radiobacter TaxID=362 RepID=UPI001605ECCA|nr:hypothetical protein [Agrobacterium radiobacter]MBB4406243.1 hypothetical protein [Agrobacterium radiobacter]MBB4450348.1 hypothetical protein [Agrobacterium radiobacter]